MMRRGNMTYKEAVKLAKKQRPCVDPMGHLEQLLQRLELSMKMAQEYDDPVGAASKASSTTAATKSSGGAESSRLTIKIDFKADSALFSFAGQREV